jgi:predicted restriction endonuclease
MRYATAIKETRPSGQYANYLEIGYNAFEFILDFGQFHPEDSKPRFNTRIISTPSHLRAFLEVILHSVEEYEQNYGYIRNEEEMQHLVAEEMLQERH